MGYIKKNNKTKRMYAIEALEILKKEGVDITKIAPKRSFNGVKRYILLKEVRCDRIDEIIKEHNLDPNLNLGSQIYIMRTKMETFDLTEQMVIQKLGIKKSNVFLGNSSGEEFRNQIHETLSILEKLREEGIDIPFIPRIVNGDTSHLKDIDSPETLEIITKLGLSEDLPIGRRISTVIAEYSPKNKKHNYQKSSEDVMKINEFGLLNSYEDNIENTIEVLRKLKEKGIDITSVKRDMVNSDGTKRKRYLYEIEDPKINPTIQELGLPRFFVIGKRLIQVKSYMLSEKYPEEKRRAIKEQLVEWDLYRDRENKDESELAILEKEQRNLESKLQKANNLSKQVDSECEKKNETQK